MTLDSFSTARLRGERMTMEHLAAVRRMHRDEQFMAHLGGVRSDEATLDYLRRNVAHWEEHGFGIWILRDNLTREVIGRGGLRHLDLDGVDEIEIGFAVLPNSWGRGLAT